MEKKIEWGIKSVKFAPLAAGGAFPDFTNAASADLIEMDSFTHEEADNESNEINWEDQDTALTLAGTPGAKSITFISNNVSPEAYKFFKQYKEGEGANAGYIVNDPQANDAQTLAMQYVTREIGEYPALEYEFTPVLVTVKKTGTTGKNGLPGLSFSCIFQPNFAADGKSIPNMRYRPVPAVPEG